MKSKLFSLGRWMIPLALSAASYIFPLPLKAAPAGHVPMEQPPKVSHEQVVDKSPVSARLISEQQTIAPGTPFWVGVELKMEKGWDTYWVNPGDAGFPTKIDWHLPEGFTAGPVQWPYPQKFTNDSLVGFGYTDSVTLLTKITPPKELSADHVDLKADVSWLACKEQCMPGNAALNMALPVSQRGAEIDASQTTAFADARALLPQKGSVTVSEKKGEILLNLKGSYKNIDHATFIPEQQQVIDYGAPQAMHIDRGGMQLSVKRFSLDESLPPSVKGVLLLSDAGTTHVIQVDSALHEMAASSASHLSSFGVALVLAILGGMILNVMPCVLPVIALKIFSFVKMAHEKRSVILKHGGLFSMGVIMSFWVLSGALLVLRAYGQSVGWGFQLQEPVFVAALAGILFLLGLSLFGVFEMGTSLISLGQKAQSTRSPYLSSFLSGVLATLVATPCTGPLLGPALGFAMTLAPLKALLIFTGMGLGMSSPYLLFSAFPKLVRFLPKPGNWMITFKQIMGFLMMATVIWLIWVFGAQTGHMALLVMLISLLVMAVGAWIFGKWGTPVKGKLTRTLAIALFALTLVTGGTGVVEAAKKYKDVPAQIADQSGAAWDHYSPEKVAELQAAGTPVFIDFTAKWCLICQANKVTLHSADVANMFKENGVVTMEADWTKKDPVITEKLQELGRSGVPVYVLYPGKPHAEPLILPQTLTGKTIQDYLHKLND